MAVLALSRHRHGLTHSAGPSPLPETGPCVDPPRHPPALPSAAPVPARLVRVDRSAYDVLTEDGPPACPPCRRPPR